MNIIFTNDFYFILNVTGADNKHRRHSEKLLSSIYWLLDSPWPSVISIPPE